MIQERCGLRDYPRHGVALIEVRYEVIRQTRQGKPRPVIARCTQRVETPIVFGHKRFTPCLVGEHPPGELLADLGGLGLRGERGLHVQHALVVVDHHAARVAQRLEQTHRVGSLAGQPPRFGHQTPEAVMGGHVDDPAATDVLHGRRGHSEGLRGELGHHPWGDPGCPRAYPNLLGGAIGWHHLAQRAYVVPVDGVGAGGRGRVGQLLAHVARQRRRGGHQLVGVVEVGIDQPLQQITCSGRVDVEQAGDEVQVDATRPVQAHRQRFLRTGGAEQLGALGHQVGGEDLGLAGLAGGLVEDFQRGHHRPAGIVAHPAVEVAALLVRRGCLPRLGIPLVEKLGRYRTAVGPSGLALLGAPLALRGGDLRVVALLGDFLGSHPAEAVDRAVAAHVGVVEVVEVPAQLIALGAGAPVALGGDETVGGVAQRDQFPRLGHQRLGGVVGVPAVPRPVLDAASLGVVAQREQGGVLALIGGGDQSRVEVRRGHDRQVVGRGGEPGPAHHRGVDDLGETSGDLGGQLGARAALDRQVRAAV